jgi:DNA polymerase
MLEEIEREIRSCKKCALWHTKTDYVPGEGSKDAEIMFIGEAPGREEDLQGRPFVGNAGKLLTEMIENILGLKRGDVFIANILKCRPPNNRDPLPEEVEACSPYLLRQLEVIKPSVVVCLGRYSANFIFNLFGIKFPGISRVRGEVKEVGGIRIIAIYHPAAVLYRPQLRDAFEKDFRRITEIRKKRLDSTLLDFI